MIGVVNDGTRRVVSGPRLALRRPLSQPVLIDLALVLVFAGSYVLWMVLRPHPDFRLWWWPALVAIPATATLMVRRRFPWMSLTTLLVVTTAFTWMQAPVGCLNLTILVAVYSVCVKTELLGGITAAGVAMLWPASKLWLVQAPVGDDVLMIVGSVVNLVMVVGWGRSMRVKRTHAGQLEQTVSLLDQARDQLAAEAATVERARIAREFHDIVSHNLSVVALRAGVARSLVDKNPDYARETLAELEQASRSSMEEMRHLLSALRENADSEVYGPPSPGDREQFDRQPAPGLARVDALVDSVRETGVVWRLVRRGVVRDLGPGVEMTAYRIVQEAVTNVLKHAGSGYARVVLEYQVNGVRIEVSNHATNPEAAAGAGKSSPRAVEEQGCGASGHGLIGLRERVSLLGGALTAHPVPNGFHLSAVLPCPEMSDLV